MGFKKLEAWDMPGNPFEMIEHQAALFTAGTKEHFNTMTIGWGLMGDLWNVPAFTAYVRPSRYTWQFAEENDCFTVSFFGTPRPQALAVLGTKSGRDMDKIHQSGLTPVELEGQVAQMEEENRQAQTALEIFTAECPNAEITLLSGGQPVYYYLISAE